MPAPASNRLFFALWPSAGIRARIAAAAASLHAENSSGGYRINPTRYHLTLYFLGDHVTPEQEAAVMKVAARIEAPPFTLQLNQAGSFSNAKVNWLGTKETPAELRYLDQMLRKAMATLSAERQPGFVPHLTIERDIERALPLQTLDAIDWRVDDFALIHSILRRPQRYEVLQHYPLRGGPLAALPQQYKLL